MIKTLSLGAGVQSSTVALMSARGDLPRFDYAIFADTGWESRRVYDWLNWLEAQLPFPVIRARRPGPDLGTQSLLIANGDMPREGSSQPPWFTRNPDGALPKHCSKEFKTRVIGREIRRILGVAPGARGPKGIAVEASLGISREEMHRMKDSEQPFVRNVFPLVDLGMRRHDCLRWMEERQYPKPPRSACIFCPYLDVGQLREIRDDPDDWRRLIAFDSAIRKPFPGVEGEAFVNRQRVPIDQVDLSTDAERGQADLFGDECDGVCGV